MVRSSQEFTGKVLDPGMDTSEFTQLQGKCHLLYKNIKNIGFLVDFSLLQLIAVFATFRWISLKSSDYYAKPSP